MRPQWDTPLRYTVLIFLLILFIAALWYVREIFQPLITAALIAYFLSPTVSFMVGRFHLRRKTAANLVYFLALTIFIGLLVSAVPLLFDELQSVTSDITLALSELETSLQNPIMIGSVPFQFGTLIPTIRQTVSAMAIPNPQDALKIIQVTSRNFLWLLVILVTAYYLMTDWEKLRTSLFNLAPRDEQNDLNRLYRDIRAVWLGYLRGQIRLIFILAILYSIVWVAIGLPGALALGVLAGLLNLLPEIGPFTVAALATTIALIEGSTYIPVSHLWFAFITLGVYLLLNNFKTIWLQPRILGQSVFLHEGVVFVAIIAAIVLQGVLGVLIIVPLLASFVVLGRYIRRRLLGLAPFADEEPVPLATQPDSALNNESNPEQTPAQEKTN
ncbi:MAG: AI-2E family transporter [Chloroflexota bacterium]